MIVLFTLQLMQTLEVRLNALSNMNSQLKNENDVLKDKIKQLENEVGYSSTAHSLIVSFC